MRNLKIVCGLFAVLCLYACEQEQILSSEENVPEAMHVRINSDGTKEILSYGDIPSLIPNSNTTNKTSHNTSEFRVYETPEDFEIYCPDLKSFGGFTTILGEAIFSIGGATYFRAEVSVSDAEELVSITVEDGSGGIIYQDQILIGSPYFFGIASAEPIYRIIFTKPVNSNYLSVFDARRGECSYELDSDGDGVPDDEDPVPNSNTESTVAIDGCDSLVENISLGDGYMLSDIIDQLEAGEYKNHGEFVKAIAAFLNGLVQDGIITEEEKGLIMNCAGPSSIG